MQLFALRVLPLKKLERITLWRSWHTVDFNQVKPWRIAFFLCNNTWLIIFGILQLEIFLGAKFWVNILGSSCTLWRRNIQIILQKQTSRSLIFYSISHSCSIAENLEFAFENRLSDTCSLPSVSTIRVRWCLINCIVFTSEGDALSSSSLQVCRHHLQKHLLNGPPGPIRTQNRKELSTWICELHNGEETNASDDSADENLVFWTE